MPDGCRRWSQVLSGTPRRTTVAVTIRSGMSSHVATRDFFKSIGNESMYRGNEQSNTRVRRNVAEVLKRSRWDSLPFDEADGLDDGMADIIAGHNTQNWRNQALKAAFFLHRPHAAEVGAQKQRGSEQELIYRVFMSGFRRCSRSVRSAI